MEFIVLRYEYPKDEIETVTAGNLIHATSKVMQRFEDYNLKIADWQVVGERLGENRREDAIRGQSLLWCCAEYQRVWR